MRRSMCGIALALVGSSLIGCDEDAENTLGGELGNGVFIYLCLRPSDAQCDRDEQHADLALTSIATGGKFGIDYDNGDTLLPATLDRLDYDADEELWVAKKPGWVAIIGQKYGDGDDFAHLRIVDPAGLALSRREVSGEFSGSFGGVTVDVSVQSPIYLRVAPVDSDAAVLAGALDCSWSSSDTAVAEVSGDTTDNVVEVVGKTAGTATVTAELGDLSISTTVDVQP
jgi:hypothetical protein